MLASLPHEVLDTICYVLSPSAHVFRPHRREGLKALVSLARTSRLLHEPAVSAIWHTIPNISDILHTLPDDLWIESGVPLPDPEDPNYVSFGIQLVRARLNHITMLGYK